MTTLWTRDSAVQATGGVSPHDWAATGVAIDSRNLNYGDIFVALQDQRDGHDFVADALNAGAAAALVSRVPDTVPDDAPLLIVPDTLQALRDMAVAARARTRAKVIAVTGSVGKTSTKEMIRTALAGQGNVHAAEKSYNNHWGVPLTLARMPEDTDFSVLELGMNHAGEIGPLSRLAKPDVSLITTIEKAHMSAFNNIREVAHAKAEIFDGMEAGGHAILNRDNRMYPVLSRRAKRHDLTQIRFGFHGRPEFWMRRLSVDGDATSFMFRFAGTKLAAKINAPGEHLAMNAIGALAAIHAAGADLGKAVLGLTNWRPPNGRGNRVWVDMGMPEIDGSLLVIDESYNANPASVKAALNVLAGTKTRNDMGRIVRGRRIAILGDMLELGTDEAKNHLDIAGLSALSHLDRIHTVGDQMGHLHEILDTDKRGVHTNTAAEMAAKVDRLLDAGDVVMVKGSNGMRLADVVEAIKSLGTPREMSKTETA